MGKLPGADIGRDPLAQQEVDPDPVRVGLVGAVSQQQAVQVLKRQSPAKLLRHLLHELFHVLLHGVTLLLRQAPGRTNSRRHLTPSG
ncbi:hypothetical protein AHiyo4_49960 [Arthrobacter sp. Hiyo4]|nr:hypothetical protein AHiyo4_49960 [Arthrobacter sp. Hiyo4]